MNIVTAHSPANATNTVARKSLRAPQAPSEMSLALVPEHSAERSELESGLIGKLLGVGKRVLTKKNLIRRAGFKTPNATFSS